MYSFSWVPLAHPSGCNQKVPYFLQISQYVSTLFPNTESYMDNTSVYGISCFFLILYTMSVVLIRIRLEPFACVRESLGHFWKPYQCHFLKMWLSDSRTHPNGCRFILLSPLRMETVTKILIKIRPLSNDGAILILVFLRMAFNILSLLEFSGDPERVRSLRYPRGLQTSLTDCGLHDI